MVRQAKVREVTLPKAPAAIGGYQPQGS